MNFNKLLDKKWFIFFFFIILVFALKFNIINLPYIRDELGNYVAPSIWVKDNNFNPFFGNDKLGSHPPLFYEILALAFSIFGMHLWVGHTVILLSAVITLYYTYLIGSYLYKPKVGFIAALLLLFSPLFFAQIGIVMLDVFLMMMATITVYYALQKKLLPYLIIGNLLVLTKEPGVIIIGMITLYKFFFEKIKIKKLIIYFSPIFIFLLWSLLSKLVYGWFFFPDFVELFSLKIFLKIVIYRIDQVFITDYKLILTSFILFLIIKAKTIKLKSITSSGLIFFALTYITCRYIANILFLTEKIFKIDLVKIFQTNLHDLYPIRYVLPFLILIIFLIPRIFQTKEILSRKLKRGILLLLFCIISMVLFYSFISYAYEQRYLLIIYPLFFIIGSKAMVSIFKDNKICGFIIILILILFITKWWGDAYPICGSGSCEENLEYLSLTETHREMARFIESNYPNSVVLTEAQQSQELRFPFAGYVKKEIKTIGLQKDNFLKTGTNSYKIPSPDKFDLVYYSIGGGDSKELEEVVNLYNLTLIKKIEKNDKIALLYGKNKYTFPNEF